MPLHISRSRARRYNEATLLGQALCRSEGEKFRVDARRRVRATTQLVELGTQARRTEIKGAIALSLNFSPEGKRNFIDRRCDDVV